MKKINFGIIGCGWISRKTYIPILAELEGISVVSVLDNDNGRAEKTAKEFNIPNYYTELDEFLSSPIDAVIITTPNYTHAMYALKALQNNKHVICEKPTVIKTIEYIELINEAQKRNLLFIPAFVNHFRTDVTELFKAVDSGTIGEIASIEAGWIRKYGYPRLGSWFTNKKYSGGGVLMDLGPHIFNICLTVLGNAPVKQTHLTSWYEENLDEKKLYYSANWYEQGYDEMEINVETTCFGKVELAEGRIIDFKLSWNAPVKNDYTYFTVVGKKGLIQLQTLFGFSTNRVADFNQLIIKKSQTHVERIIFDNAKDEQIKSFKRLCEFFVECISKSYAPEMLLRNGQQTVSLIEELYRNESISKYTLTGKDFFIG